MICSGRCGKYFQTTAMERISYRLQDGFGFREILLQDILYIECCGHTLTIFKRQTARG